MTAKICITAIVIVDIIWGTKGGLSFCFGLGYLIYKLDKNNE